MKIPNIDGRNGPIAVVLGFEFNGIGMTRALARRGVRCWAVTGPGWMPFHASRSVKRVVRADAWTRQSVIETLLAVGRELERPGVLLITKDEAVIWASSAAAELGKFFHLALPEPDVVQLLMNKALFRARAEAEGWPVPRGFIWSDEDELRRLLPEISFPAILKPQLRNSEYRKQKVAKVYRVANAEELLAAYRKIAQWEKEAILSEWIEGRDDTLYSCRGFWDRDGRPVVQHVARKLMQWPIEAGNGSAVEVPDPAVWAEPVAIANRIFASVKMFGIGAMEFKRHRDGRFLILEPCVGRTVLTHEVGPINGFDVPWAAYRYLATEGAVREPQPEPKAGRLCLIDVPRARRSVLEYRRSSHFSDTEIAAVFARPHFDMTYRREDPMPQVLMRGRSIWKRAKRVVRLPLA